MHCNADKKGSSQSHTIGKSSQKFNMLNENTWKECPQSWVDHPIIKEKIVMRGSLTEMKNNIG
jgi:hypothetical protein